MTAHKRTSASCRTQRHDPSCYAKTSELVTVACPSMSPSDRAGSRYCAIPSARSVRTRPWRPCASAAPWRPPLLRPRSSSVCSSCSCALPAWACSLTWSSWWRRACPSPRWCVALAGLARAAQLTRCLAATGRGVCGDAAPGRGARPRRRDHLPAVPRRRRGRRRCGGTNGCVRSSGSRAACLRSTHVPRAERRLPARASRAQRCTWLR